MKTQTRVTETLAEFLEKAQRPGLLGLVGKTVQKRCQRDLETYFKALGKRVVEMKFEALADPDRGIGAEHAGHAVTMRMHNLLRNRRPLLTALLQVNIISAIETANKISLVAEAEADADEPPVTEYPGMTADQAAAYAAEQVNDTIVGIDATTLESVADAVSAGISQRLGVPGTAKLIKDVVDGMSTWRAEMIASTEMNDAMSQAYLGKLKRNAVEMKQWILGPNACDQCVDNAEASPIPVDDDFPSGDDAPPAHPKCVCAVAGARMI